VTAGPSATAHADADAFARDDRFVGWGVNRELKAAAPLKKATHPFAMKLRKDGPPRRLIQEFIIPNDGGELSSSHPCRD